MSLTSDALSKARQEWRTFMTLTASSTVRPSTIFISTLTTYSRLFVLSLCSMTRYMGGFFFFVSALVGRSASSICNLHSFSWNLVILKHQMSIKRPEKSFRILACPIDASQDE